MTVLAPGIARSLYRAVARKFNGRARAASRDAAYARN